MGNEDQRYDLANSHRETAPPPARAELLRAAHLVSLRLSDMWDFAERRARWTQDRDEWQRLSGAVSVARFLFGHLRQVQRVLESGGPLSAAKNAIEFLDELLPAQYRPECLNTLLAALVSEQQALAGGEKPVAPAAASTEPLPLPPFFPPLPPAIDRTEERPPPGLTIVQAPWPIYGAANAPARVGPPGVS